MYQPNKPNPDKPAPNKPDANPSGPQRRLHGAASRGPAGTRAFRAVRALRVAGRGRIVIHLTGTGHVNLQRGRFDDFCFEGRGMPKHLSAEQVHLDRAQGTVILEGTQLVVEFSGGLADVELSGTFETETRGGDAGPSHGDLPGRRAA